MIRVSEALVDPAAVQGSNGSTVPGTVDRGSERKGSELTDGVPVVDFRSVSKTFPGVDAVAEVSLAVSPGEVHAIAGENGAGKSTLMNLLAQREEPSEGEILIDGDPVDYQGPRHAQALGISMVHQELALFPHLSVADNLFIGHERGGLALRRREESIAAKDLLQRVDLEVNPRRPVSALSIAEQQLLEIAKALSVEAKVVIMDEPTASLSGNEVTALLTLVKRLRAQGITVLYVTHRLEEIFDLADRVTVMRDGQLVKTLTVADASEDDLVRLMVGRDLKNLYARPAKPPGEAVLAVRGLSSRKKLHDCSFTLREGEIVGLAGIVGAGRSELARAIFGAEPADAGVVELDGQPVDLRSPRDAMRRGIVYVSEDRKRDGLLLNRSVAENVTLAALPGGMGTLNRRRESGIARKHVEGLRIRTNSIHGAVRLLSGGSQQKVLIARALAADARILILDEPARGIDIGAKAEVFALIGRLAEQGKAILLISSYLPELLNMCHRILVMKDGRISGDLDRSECSEERIAALATTGGARQ